MWHRVGTDDQLYDTEQEAKKRKILGAKIVRICDNPNPQTLASTIEACQVGVASHVALQFLMRFQGPFAPFLNRNHPNLF